MLYKQSPSALMLIRPSAFGFNDQTVPSNTFQHSLAGAEISKVREAVSVEFNRLADVLVSNNIDARIFDDSAGFPAKPDAIFPNNWVSFHGDGRIVLYPMMAENRRQERRVDIIEKLASVFVVKEILNYTEVENKGKFLEGTGSVVFDHQNKVAYACRSPRTNEELLNDLCEKLRYKAFVFNAVDESGVPVYHTNVILSIGEKFAVLCLDAIHDDEDQEKLLESFAATGRQVIAISYLQMCSFAGNILEVESLDGRQVILLSENAFQSMLPGQIATLSRYAELLQVKIDTIERYGGGGVRCMLADIHLPRIIS